MNKIFNIISEKKPVKNPPIWIMRQAGRYLPEYREIRSKVGDFLSLCYNPKLASEVTLQPLKRFDLDAAIIFSDILVIPHALGVDVSFVKNEGPKLGDFNLSDLKISNIENHLNPVFEALALTKSQLGPDKTLIGFSGAPWTLACYMIEKGGSKNFEEVRRFSIEKEAQFQELINILTESVIEYLSLKINAGADVVKIFDSWAGILPPAELQKWVINPTKKIVTRLKEKHPKTPIIAFPRGIANSYKNFSQQVKADIIALDQNVDRNWAKENIAQILQGNLDNFLLAFGSKEKIKNEVNDILKDFANTPFIFNLGHGILPETPIENVELLIKLIRDNGV